MKTNRCASFAVLFIFFVFHLVMDVSKNFLKNYLCVFYCKILYNSVVLAFVYILKMLILDLVSINIINISLLIY